MRDSPDIFLIKAPAIKPAFHMKLVRHTQTNEGVPHHRISALGGLSGCRPDRGEHIITTREHCKQKMRGLVKGRSNV